MTAPSLGYAVKTETAMEWDFLGVPHYLGRISD